MSQFKTFVLPRCSDEVSEHELNAFLRGHRVVSVTKAYDAGCWTFCVEWIDGSTAEPEGRGRKFSERVDYMKILPPEVFAVFARLRDVRRELAKAAGVPPFTVATDAQLAEMARLEEPTLASIGSIEGFGESRLNAYGEALLAALLPAQS